MEAAANEPGSAGGQEMQPLCKALNAFSFSSVGQMRKTEL